MHVAARALFCAAVVTGAIVFAVVTVASLQPKPVSIAPQRDVAVAKLDALGDGVPQKYVVPELRGLDLAARRQRSDGLPFLMLGPRATRDGDLAVWLVRSDGVVRGFIGLDPRDGCDLELLAPSAQATYHAVFHDVCHGSLYDVDGIKAGGPTPWNLDELVLSVRGGIVYADLHAVKPGQLAPR